MSRTFRWSMACLAVAAAVLAVSSGVAGQIYLGTQPTQGPWAAQPSTKSGEWPHYNADIRGTRYSPLDQITT